jgi:thiol-disulfide isomerase/thioredoxin
MVSQLISSIALLGVTAFGQDGTRRSCQEPADVHNLSLKEIRERLDAGQDEFFLYKRLLDLTPDRPRTGTLEPLFEKKLKEHSNDLRYLYLYGRSLIGKRTPDAMVQLKRVVELDPDFPWTYLEFARVYTSPNFDDRIKRAQSLQTYRKLCPASLEGYNWARSESDLVKNQEWAKHFRGLLEKNTGQSDHVYWTNLWATEFRLTPKSDYDKLRKQVTEDLKRLESTPETWRRSLLADLATGYRLAERPEAAERIERRLDPDGEALKADQTLMKETNWGSKLTPEQREAAFREAERRAEEWVKKWPQSSLAWQQLLEFLPNKPGWTRGEMEHAGLQAMKTDAAMEREWSYISEPLRVAKKWVQYGIRPKDCVAIAEKALGQISLGPEVRSDLIARSNEKQRQAGELFGFNLSLFDSMSVIADGSIQMKDFDKARDIIARMQIWLNDNQALDGNPSSGFNRFRGVWLNSQGKLAEADGRKMDAIAFYVKAIETAGRLQDADTANHAEALWGDMGGTKEGWDSLTARPASPKPAATAKTAVTPVFQFASWKPVNRALDEINLKDVAGRTWTLADLREKTTFVTAWATWCGPCRDELPAVQKLYELAKSRDDVQVITLNFDEDPGLVEPFLSSYHYTFPVLMSARDFAESVVQGELGVPQNWLVDRSAMLRERSIGFDDKIPDWPKAMLEKLAPR